LLKVHEKIRPKMYAIGTWDLLRKELLNKLIDEMGNRTEAVFEADG
jgi:hypothetical protein